MKRPRGIKFSQKSNKLIFYSLGPHVAVQHLLDQFRRREDRLRERPHTSPRRVHGHLASARHALTANKQSGN